MLDPVTGGLIASGISAATKLFGGNKQLKAQEKANAQNAALQKEFAQSSIRWRVADAKKAGLHPLAALGAAGTSASPSFQAGDYSFIGDMGQDVGSAVNRTLSPNAQNARYYAKVATLDLENRALQNDLLRSQIAKERAAPAPGLPSASDTYLLPGQASSGTAPAKGPVDENRVRHFAHPQLKNVELGAGPETTIFKTGGGYTWAPSKHFKDSSDEYIPAQIGYFIRNNLLPLWDSRYSHAKALPPPPKGHYWQNNPFKHEYVPYRKARPHHSYRR